MDPQGPRALNICEKDVHKYGPTLSCQACIEVLIGRKRGKGATQYVIAHNDDCRARMKVEMKRGPIDTERVDKADDDAP